MTLERCANQSIFKFKHGTHISRKDKIQLETAQQKTCVTSMIQEFKRKNIAQKNNPKPHLLHQMYSIQVYWWTNWLNCESWTYICQLCNWFTFYMLLDFIWIPWSNALRIPEIWTQRLYTKYGKTTTSVTQWVEHVRLSLYSISPLMKIIFMSRISKVNR